MSQSNFRNLTLWGLCAVTLGAAPGNAQVYPIVGSGRTSVYGSFHPVVQPRIPDPYPSLRVPLSVQRLPVIPLDEYERRKSVVSPRIPARSPGPPQLVYTHPSGSYTPEYWPTPPLELTPAISFEGITQTVWTPPSPNAAAGPSDILQIVNSSLARFDKTGVRTDLATLQQFYATILSTLCPSGSLSCLLADPSVRYDQLHGRFLITIQATDFTARTSYFVISVSNGATYADGWKHWVLDARLDGSLMTNHWADFPQVGFDHQMVYLTALMFSFSSNTFQYAKLRLLKKSELYDPATTTLTWKDFANLKNHDETTVSTLQPLHFRGRPLVGGSTAMLINASDVAGATYLTLWRITDPTGANPTIARSTIQGVWPYDYPTSAPQAGSSILIDTGQSSILKAVNREGIIYTAQNVKFSDVPSSVVYTRVNTASDQVTLQARWIEGHFFYPAFDVPATFGPINGLPNKLIVGSTTDTLGNVTYPGFREVKDGVAAYEVTSNGRTARWGDFFGGAIDPQLGGLWVSGEYAKAQVSGVSQWGTWNAYFPWNSAQQFGDVAPSHPAYHYINALKLWGITAGCACNPPTFCPENPIPRKEFAVFLIRALYGYDFTYSTTPYFQDVPSTHPYFNFIQKLREIGLTAGCSANPPLFCPDNTLTRWEAAIFIVRGKLRGLHGDNFPYPATPYFTDVPSTDGGFRFVQKMRELGITAGCTPTTYCRDEPLKRWHAAIFVTRAFLN